MMDIQGVWKVIQGATKKILNKKLCKVFALYVTYSHFASAFNIILCMRDTVVLKSKQNENFKNILQSSPTG